MSKKALASIVAVLFFSAICFGLYSFIYNQTAHAFVAFLNVGQGDAIVIQSKTNETVLIDTGPDDRVIYELSEVLPANDNTIETLVITHPDADHIGGMIAVLKHFTVKRILTSGMRDNATMRKIIHEVERQKIPLIPVSYSDDFYFENGEEDGFFDVLYPFSPLVYSNTDANNDSVVMRFALGHYTILFTGDIETQTESQLVNAYGKKLHTQVLKLGHHGSKTSSTATFLKAVGPELAVASAGKNNKFNHPSAEVIERLKLLGIPLRVTKDEGRIRMDLL